MFGLGLVSVIGHVGMRPRDSISDTIVDVQAAAPNRDGMTVPLQDLWRWLGLGCVYARATERFCFGLAANAFRMQSPDRRGAPTG